MTAILSVSGTSSNGTTLSPITVGGLPRGIGVDFTQGALFGDPQTSQNGIMRINMSDGKSSISFPYVLNVTVPDADTHEADIEELLDIILTNLSVKHPTTYQRRQAIKAFYQIVQIILQDPRNALMDLLRNHMITYAKSIYDERVFCIGLELGTLETIVVSAVYTAFRQITVAVQTSVQTDVVFAVTQCVPLVNYLISHGIPGGLKRVNATVDTKSVGEYTYTAGDCNLPIGGKSYLINLSGDSTLSFVPDTALFQTPPQYLVESLYQVELVDGTIAFDPTITVSTYAGLFMPNLTTTGTHTLILYARSFDGGKTTQITHFDVID